MMTDFDMIFDQALVFDEMMRILATKVTEAIFSATGNIGNQI